VNSFAGFKAFEPVLLNPDKFEPRLAVFFGIGLAFTTFLAWMRTQYVWWPSRPWRSPVRLVEHDCLLVPIFIAWIVKSLILRYRRHEGLQLFAAFLPGLDLRRILAGRDLGGPGRDLAGQGALLPVAVGDGRVGRFVSNRLGTRDDDLMTNRPTRERECVGRGPTQPRVNMTLAG